MPLSTNSTLIPVADIIVPQRLRTEQSNTDLEGHIAELRDSIERFGGAYKGLLQPLLVNERRELQDGYCRLQAVKELGWDLVPCYHRDTLSDVEYHEIELECNIRRMGFTWQEIVRQVVRIHDNRWRDAAKRSEKWTATMTGALLGGYSQTYVDNCRRIEPHLSDPRYSSCDGITDAIRLYLRDKEDAAVAEQAKRLNLIRETVPIAPTRPQDAMTCIACEGTGMSSNGLRCPICGGNKWVPPYDPEQRPEGIPEPIHEVNLSNSLFHGDCISILRGWPQSCVDHIITDPPYGIDMANLDQATTSLMDMSTVAETHDVLANLQLFSVMFKEMYRVLRPSGFCIVWFDISNFTSLVTHAEEAGFAVQRWPLVWYKTSVCKNQMAHINTTKNFELALVLRKGDARLPRPAASSVIVAPTADKFRNPFAKPYDVWKYCYETFTTPGQLVLDPFAGEGSSVTAGLRLSRYVFAIEIGDDYFYMIEQVKAYWDNLLKGKVTYT